MGKLKAVLSVGAFAAVLAILSFRVAIGMNVPGRILPDEWVFTDFRDAVYYPVVSFLSGENPYEFEAYTKKYVVLCPFAPYSPLFLLVHSPFGLLPQETAQLTHFVLSIVLSVGLAALCLKFCGQRPDVTTVCGLTALIMVSRPGQFNLLIGQTTLEFVFAVYVAIWTGSRVTSLAPFAVAAATMKPTFGFPLVILMVCQGRLRTVLTGLGAAAIATGAAMIPVARAAGGIPELIVSMWETYRNTPNLPAVDPVTSMERVDAVAFLSRLWGSPLGFGVELVVFTATMTAAGAALWHVHRRWDEESARLFNISISCLAILLAVYQKQYGALLLTLPLASLAFGCWFKAGQSISWTMRWTLLVLLAVPAVNFLAGWRALHHFEERGLAWLTITSVNGGALIIAFLLHLILAFSRKHGPSVQTPTEPPSS
ncbi:MAG: hypothetical protein C3F08_00465 [Candidatus Methylomirabilota bacterium]|nr:MAG: hypothetical protein C3F08_00465 [candidate division NC10 bacterium]